MALVERIWFFATCVSAWLISHLAAKTRSASGPPVHAEADDFLEFAHLSSNWAIAVLSLMGWFVVLLALLLQF